MSNPSQPASRYFCGRSQCSHYQIFPGVDAFTATGETMTLSLVEMAPNSVVEEHSHPHEQVGMVVDGSAVFRIGDEEKLLIAGDMYLIPGNTKHRIVARDQGCKALDTFHPVREEYR